MNNKPPVPSESVEQRSLFRWAAWASGKHPELARLFHIPNGGARSAATGARMKAEGVKRGVPDICLPVPRGSFTALYIELKRQDGGGKATDEQKAWMEFLTSEGSCALECWGFDEAKAAIERYLALPRPTVGDARGRMERFGVYH